jgi:hypothetical protein
MRGMRGPVPTGAAGGRDRRPLANAFHSGTARRIGQTLAGVVRGRPAPSAPQEAAAELNDAGLRITMLPVQAGRRNRARRMRCGNSRSCLLWRRRRCLPGLSPGMRKQRLGVGRPTYRVQCKILPQSSRRPAAAGGRIAGPDSPGPVGAGAAAGAGPAIEAGKRMRREPGRVAPGFPVRGLRARCRKRAHFFGEESTLGSRRLLL